MWGLDDGPLEETTLAQFKEQQKIVCSSVLHLTQALAKLEERKPPGLLLITSGSQFPTSISGLPHPETSVLWGLGRVIAREHPQLRCTCIDLDLSSEGSKQDPAEDNFLH